MEAQAEPPQSLRQRVFQVLEHGRRRDAGFSPQDARCLRLLEVGFGYVARCSCRYGGGLINLPLRPIGKRATDARTQAEEKMRDCANRHQCQSRLSGPVLLFG